MNQLRAYAPQDRGLPIPAGATPSWAPPKLPPYRCGAEAAQPVGVAKGPEGSATSSIGQIHVHQRGADVCVVSLSGEHDLSNAEKLKERLTEVHRHGTSVIVDLTNAAFVESAVLATILGQARLAGPTPGDSFTLVAPHGSPARRFFDLVGLSGIPLIEALDAALPAQPSAG